MSSKAQRYLSIYSLQVIRLFRVLTPQTKWIASTTTRLSSAVLLLSLLLLSGCQGTRPTIAPDLTVGLDNLNHWQVKARMAIRTPEDSFSATLDWEKLGPDFDFHIYGTFGVTYAHLTQQAHLATLKMPDDQVFYHQDAEQLLYQSLGWEFPIDALAFWIKGLPSNKSGETITRGDNGELMGAYLNNWQVEFSRYQLYSGYSMPRIIKAKHPRMTIKVVVRDWEFLPAI